MNPFLLRHDERLAEWREFRKTISEIPDDEKFLHVAKYWAQTPIKNIAYDIEDLGSLPTPWEMMYEGEWCRNSIAIGMEFTLRFAGIDENRMELRQIIDPTISDMMLALVIDEKYMLNYDWGNVTQYKLAKSVRIIKRIRHIKDKYVDV